MQPSRSAATSAITFCSAFRSGFTPTEKRGKKRKRRAERLSFFSLAEPPEDERTSIGSVVSTLRPEAVHFGSSLSVIIMTDKRARQLDEVPCLQSPQFATKEEIMGFAIMRCEKLKSISAATSRQKHNERAKGRALSDRTQEKVIKLRSSAAPQLRDELSFSEFYNRKLKGQKVRFDAVKGFEVILTFSHGAVSDADLKEWAGENFKFLCDVFGAENLHRVDLHLSETTPHIHAITTCFDVDGKLRSKAFIDGPAHLRRLQDQYAAQMARFGLQRGISKKLTKAQHKELRDWYAETNYKVERLNAYERTFGNEKTWDMDTYIEFVKNTGTLSSDAPERQKNAIQEHQDR